MGFLDRFIKRKDFQSEQVNNQEMSIFAIDNDSIENSFILDIDKDSEQYGIINEPNKKFDLPEYDESFSLNVFLSQIGIHPAKVEEILKITDREKRINSALSSSDLLEAKRYLPERCCFSEANRIRDRIIIKFIAKKLDITECTELTFMYLLCKIGEIIFWNIEKQCIYSFQWQHLNSILNSKDYHNIIKFFDNGVVSCFKYYIGNKSQSIDSIMNLGYSFIKSNCNNANTIQGSLYQKLGEDTVINILNRIFQVIIDSDEFKVSNILVKKPNKKESLTSSLKYDINNMVKFDGPPHSYQLGDNEKVYLQKDFDVIRDAIMSDMTVNKYLNKITIDVKDIDFTGISSRMEYTEFTPTGKSPKYPYKICLFAKMIKNDYMTRPNYSLFIEYDSNQEIGKFKYSVYIDEDNYEISGKRVANKLEVTKILKNYTNI